MSQRISHSLLDPLIFPLVGRFYRALHLPKQLPPEAIVGGGHLLAIVGAFGFAFSTKVWWAALVAAAGVAGNHAADMIDGTHARRTGQCRNGGELLDHFTDPLSFSYWMVGLGVSCGRLDLALVSVIWIYATAVLTNIRAKMVGEFTLARIGPTEFKALLVFYALGVAALTAWTPLPPTAVALGTSWVLAAAGVLQLAINLVRSVRDVNRRGDKPDTNEWKVG